jgi:ribosomal protein S18 acetylase RimI-like enzyme
MKPTIRQALISDLEALNALSHRTIGASYRRFLSEEVVEAFLGSGAVQKYVRENLGQCWVIRLGETIVGYSVWRDDRRDAAPTGLIDLMMIDPPWHRHGFGTELLRQIEALLFRRYPELRLESFAGNDAANAFYRKHGWCEANRYLDPDSGVEKIVFRKARSPGSE